METKKILIPTIIAIATLLILVFGATYAYFAVDIKGSFGTTNITGSAASIGSVSLSAGSNNLSMALTTLQMVKQASNVTYYASPSGTTTTSTEHIIGTAKVTGSGTYSCTYNLSVSATGTNNMYTKFQSMGANKTTNQIQLIINGQTYDFNTANLFTLNLTNQSMTGLTSSSSKNITAQLKVVNRTDIDQSDLAGTDITISFNASNFECVPTA